MGTGFILYNIGMIATPTGNKAKAGSMQGEIKRLENAYIVVDEQGIFKQVGIGALPKVDSYLKKVDAKGALVTPGLVDAHTHLVFGGWREQELALKLKGVPYLSILAQGGGILSTVEMTRKASEKQLEEKAKEVLLTMLSMGTTTCEIKSGYGLSFEDELKQLKVIQHLKESQVVELVATFMGAHTVPKEYQDNREAYITLLIDEIIPTVAKEHLAEFCDVFCETGVFSVEESRCILEKGKQYGLIPKIHADEIDPIGGSNLAGEIGAISAEHLICTQKEGMKLLAKSGTIAVLLPGTSFYLDKPFAKAREMIEQDVPVAVATDFNPGSCPSLSLQLAMNLACYKYKMTPEEVLTAVTLNGAAAINRADKIGTIEVGKQADFVIWNGNNLNYIFYRFGNNLVDRVVKRGIFMN